MKEGERENRGRSPLPLRHSFPASYRERGPSHPTAGQGQPDPGLRVGYTSGLSASAGGSDADGTWSSLFCSGSWMLLAHVEMDPAAHRAQRQQPGSRGYDAGPQTGGASWAWFLGHSPGGMAGRADLS